MKKKIKFEQNLACDHVLYKKFYLILAENFFNL